MENMTLLEINSRRGNYIFYKRLKTLIKDPYSFINF